MKHLVVVPEKVITGDFAIHDLEKLNFYYSAIISGATFPITLVRPSLCSFEQFREYLRRNEVGDNLDKELLKAGRLEEAIRSWLNQGVEFILCDGNHRGVAYTLACYDIPAREIETFEDIKDINLEFRENESKGPYILRESKSLKHYLFTFYEALSQNTLRTLKGKVSELTKSGELLIENDKIVYKPDLPF